MEPGRSYLLEIWARSDAGEQPLTLALKSVCDGAEEYPHVTAALTDPTSWTLPSGAITVPTCSLTEDRFYVEGPAADVSFYVDDAALYLLD